MKERFESFIVLITEINRCIQKIKENEMQEFGLKARHTLCLYYLGKNKDGITSSDLSKYCKEDKAAISRTITDLIYQGFVKCNNSNGKRTYRSLLFLTQKGKNIVKIINQKIEKAVYLISKDLPDEQINNLYNTLYVILNNCKEYKYN